jgi:hypothetical protein
MVITRSHFLRMKKFQMKIVETIKAHILCSIIPPPPHPYTENRAVYEITWTNLVQLDRPQTTTWRMRIACRIPKATNTHSEYVTLIAFPLQQWVA